MKMKKKLSENILDKFSIDFLRNQVLKNAYGNDDTVIARLDPRILLVWYLFFGLVPWFVNNLWFLMACFLLVLITTVLARVAGLVLLLFAVGVFTQTGYLLVVSFLFGGDASTIVPAADPHPEGRHLLSGLRHRVLRIGSGPSVQRADVVRMPGTTLLFHLLRLSDPAMLMEEFQNILLSFRMRGNPPAHERFWGKVKYLFYQVKVVMHAFYPLMLNTAKRSRTTVEALEIKGYRYAAVNKAVKKMKLATLKVTYNDLLFLAVSFLWIAVSILLSTLF